MPRTSVRVKPKPEGPNSMIASAASITRDALAKPRRGTNREWQAEAWRFFDTVGELRNAATYLGKALSRVELNIQRRTPDGPVAVTEGLAVDALNTLFEGETGRAQMMETLGIHLTTPGESYIVAIPSTGAAPDEWLILSNEEIRGGSGGWSYDRGEGRVPIPDDALVMRIWRSHPKKWVEADSAVRAVLPILREIEALTKHVGATVDSRLAGAGVLLLPSEMTFATPGTDAEIPADPNSDPFLIAFTESMLKPIEDRASAAAVVPIVIRAPGAVLQYAQHLTFSTPFDEQARSLREEALTRLARGMDLPPEIMLGQGDSNHWSAWQIDESALKIYIEPLAELVADAFTRKWMWPILEAAGEPDYDLFVGWDTSGLRVRPNHATEAVELYDRGELTADALRRETGFDESDKPDDAEFAQILLRKLAMANNDATLGAIRALGIQIEGADPGTRYQPIPEPVVETPTGRDRELPDREESRAASAQLAAVEMVVLRALERANNRITRRSRQPKVCSVAECDQALVGAWTYVPHLASQLGLNPEWLQSALDQYARAVLSGEIEHCAETLATHLVRARPGVGVG
jgi:hypothetical protein